MADNKSLTVKEVATLLKLAPRSVQKLLHAGRAPHARREGRRWYVPERDIKYLTDRQPGRPWHRTVLHKTLPTQKETDLKTSEAAAELGISLPRMKVLLADGRLPNAYKKGGDWRVPKTDLKFVRERNPGRPWDKN